ncbi:MAG: rRNA adenine N-6-methyltransferase family protein [Candidatus ainarchaeum sp.]|nr:rRNA adenine N-6-methyltransferase family protein [Candidatus ainarchaeum sp.]
MYLTLETIQDYLIAKKENKTTFETTFDLGISKTTWPIDKFEALLDKCPKIRNEDIVFYDEKKKEGVKLQISNENGIFSLRKDKNENKPILYINAVKMNVSKDLGIDAYNENVMDSLEVSTYDDVLEICTGAGYKTLLLAEKAKNVVSIEKSKEVLELMTYNPYTKELLKKENVKIITDDATNYAKKSKEKFTKILHDPPTFKFAPELYTKEFYADLYGLAEEGCILFHYTGNPGNKFRGKDLTSATIERAKQAGWKLMKRYDLGIYFRK